MSDAAYSVTARILATPTISSSSISSSAVQANSSHAWVHNCMRAQKKGRERAYFAFELSSYGVSLFSFVGGN